MKLNFRKILYFIFIIFIVYQSLNIVKKVESNIIETKIEEENKEIHHGIFNMFFVKNTIVAGAIAFVIGLKTRDLIGYLLDAIVNPIFSSGLPNMKHLQKLLKINMFGIHFFFGEFMLEFIKYLVFLVIIYIIVIIIYAKTDLISL